MSFIDKKSKLLGQEMIVTAYSWGCINIECDEMTQNPVIIITHDDAFNWVEFSKHDLIEELKRLSVTHITIKDGLVWTERGLKFTTRERAGLNDYESIVIDMPSDDMDDAIRERKEAYISFNNSITRG